MVVALCLLLAGCGAKSGNIRVRITDVGPRLQPQYLANTLAQSLGFYRKEGLDVTIETVPSAAKSMQALVGGSVEVACITYMQTIQLAAEGQHVRTFFVGMQRAFNVLVVSPRTSRKIQRIEDLKDALVGIPSPGSPSHLCLNYYLASRGVRPDAVHSVAIGVAASAVAAVESGRIDAAVLAGGDHLRLVRRDPSLRILVDGSSAEIMRDTFGGHLYASGALAAKQEWLDRNPEVARRLARAAQGALHWIATHSAEEIRAQLPESGRSQDAEGDLEINRWSLGGFTPDGRMPVGAPEAMKRYLDATVDNVRNARIHLAETWTNEFLPQFEGK